MALNEINRCDGAAASIYFIVRGIVQRFRTFYGYFYNKER